MFASGPNHYNAVNHSSNFVLKMCLSPISSVWGHTYAHRFARVAHPHIGAAVVPYAIGLRQARARHRIHDSRHLLALLAEREGPDRQGYRGSSLLEDLRCCTKG